MAFESLLRPFEFLFYHIQSWFQSVHPDHNIYIMLFSVSLVFFSFYLVKRLINRG